MNREIGECEGLYITGYAYTVSGWDLSVPDKSDTVVP